MCYFKDFCVVFDKIDIQSKESAYFKRTVGESHICLDLNGVFGGKTCCGLRVIGVNFHICWKHACVKDLTNIMSDKVGSI